MPLVRPAKAISVFPMDVYMMVRPPGNLHTVFCTKAQRELNLFHVSDRRYLHQMTSSTKAGLGADTIPLSLCKIVQCQFSLMVAAANPLAFIRA